MGNGANSVFVLSRSRVRELDRRAIERVAIPVGVFSALKQYSLFDQVSTTFAFLGFSLPTFFSGLVIIVIFSVKLHWLPFVYDGSADGFWPNVKQSIMPVAVLGLAGAAQLMRFMRASMLEQAGMDYVVTARAKGLTERRIVFRHILRNALLPVVTIAGFQVGALIGGSVVVESVFNWPGLGTLAFESLFARDLNLLLGIFLLSSLLVVLVNLAVDLLYAVLDPRIELGR